MLIAHEYSERKRLIGNLRAHAVAHPEDAEIVEVILGCNTKIIVSQEACAKALIKTAGPDHVLDRMAKLQIEGAFGRPVGLDDSSKN